MPEKTLIFDCDGVLVDSEIIYNAVERRHLAKLGLSYTDSEYQQRFVGLSNKDFIQALTADYRALADKPFPSDFETIITRECALAFETELKAIHGAADFFAGLSRPCAVASSSKLDMLKRKLELTGLKPYFGAHIYSAEQVQNGKPSPDLFLYAASRLDSQPGQCIVIEDSANGVMAGLNAGMEVWGFVGGGHADSGMTARLTDAGAHKVFHDYISISRELAGQNAYGQD